MKSPEYPLGEPTPHERLHDAVMAGDNLARRAQALRDKLLGSMERVTPSSRSNFFTGREGRLNGMASDAERLIDEAQLAQVAFDEIEEALGVRNPPPPGLSASGGLVGVGRG